MEAQKKLFIGGNWKSNNTHAQTDALVADVLKKLAFDHNKVDVVVSPISLQLSHVHHALKGTHVQVAAQNCSQHGYGAYTGEISADHLKDAGIHWVIIGHSERRTLFGESDQIVGEKVEAALKRGLNVIACFGETLAEREAEKTEEVVERQLNAIAAKIKPEEWAHVVLAYQPVWAIGTGKVATTEQVNKVHTWIREYLTKHVPAAAKGVRIIYGGSVSEKNCVELIKVHDVDGFLVGGASLKPGFIDIVNSTTQKH